ncbi:hypothetical protein [Terracidiphilus gabretensis]|uniref:hypothetical protein n=1 Tax=Terracidiphilus gabretensis TaxID=1577687 RepID=UPI0018D25485|nr:hypothetical protein [Terracidiphilus gabretensis]
MLLADILVCVGLWVGQHILNAQGSQPVNLPEVLVGWLFVFALFSAVGWPIALPFVLLVKNITGWRFWLWLLVGACLGPASMFLFGFGSFLLNDRAAGFELPVPLILLSTPVAILTTWFYLLLLKGPMGRGKLAHAEMTDQPS